VGVHNLEKDAMSHHTITEFGSIVNMALSLGLSTYPTILIFSSQEQNYKHHPMYLFVSQYTLLGIK